MPAGVLRLRRARSRQLRTAVHHGFDEVELAVIPSRGVTYKGYRVEYDEQATRDAIGRVRRFLQRTIAAE
ncbi:MAG TPA: hypothetical protein VGJ56_24510 [Reyranella sp.]